MSWSDTGWWVGTIILLIFILIVLIVICYMLCQAFCKVEKAVEKALCEFYVFENRIVQSFEKVRERAKPVLERGMQGLEARLSGRRNLPPLRSSIPRMSSSGQVLT